MRAADANVFYFWDRHSAKIPTTNKQRYPSVSVSRAAFPPHFGHIVDTNFLLFANGDLPAPSGKKSLMFGNMTGKSVSLTACQPHV